MMWQKKEKRLSAMMLCLMYTHMACSVQRQQGIIHLGATSCYVGDNTDIIVMSEASEAGSQKDWSMLLTELAKFADNYKNQPTLAFTHFQPAQPTTVGKRATLWLQEFLMDLEDLNYVLGT